ncbi:hypothetical protein KA047_02150 [Candidatus Saccharibacteria bacterium]|nr:hypothetical protein [Candidatus Saccharibacteria bacterium]
MSELVTPNLRHYPIGSYDGAIAEFDTVPPELLKVESFVDDMGINWSTHIPAAGVPAAVAEVIPHIADVMVTKKSEQITVLSNDTEALLRVATAEDTMRLDYTIEPGELSFNGLVESLLVVWRLRDISGEPPYQLGVLTPSSALDIPRQLIAATATENVRSTPDLLDRLIKITVDASSIWTD